ncbi:uncharacterized protein TNCV_430051 [Trichonephila clavipes]|nr:uncharacterized protein TNCV_430051 [Trichonephila clavipes]
MGQQRHTIKTGDHRHLLQMMIPAYNKKGCAAFHSRREPITGESPTSFPEENTTMPYSGFEPTRLQTNSHIHHTGKLTVWCALWAGGIIGPYFFKNNEGHNVTVNGDRYRAMITNFFIPELNNHDVQELWFQQDSATCHTARATIDLLKDTFGDRLISRFRPVNWPPRSCDLTPLD